MQFCKVREQRTKSYFALESATKSINAMYKANYLIL